MADNKHVWKNIKQFFSEKHEKLREVILVEKDDIISKPTYCEDI